MFGLTKYFLTTRSPPHTTYAICEVQAVLESFTDPWIPRIASEIESEKASLKSHQLVIFKSSLKTHQLVHFFAKIDINTQIPFPKLPGPREGNLHLKVELEKSVNVQGGATWGDEGPGVLLINHG